MAARFVCGNAWLYLLLCLSKSFPGNDSMLSRARDEVCYVLSRRVNPGSHGPGPSLGHVIMSTYAPIANLYTWLEKASAYTDGSFGWSEAACPRTQHNIRLVLEQGHSLRSLEH